MAEEMSAEMTTNNLPTQVWHSKKPNRRDFQALWGLRCNCRGTNMHSIVPSCLVNDSWVRTCRYTSSLVNYYWPGAGNIVACPSVACKIGNSLIVRTRHKQVLCMEKVILILLELQWFSACPVYDSQKFPPSHTNGITMVRIASSLDA